jgi:hypothetical protein
MCKAQKQWAEIPFKPQIIYCNLENLKFCLTNYFSFVICLQKNDMQ